MGRFSAISLRKQVIFWWDDALYQTNILSFLNAACSAVNTNFIVFGLTRRMLDHTIYQSRDKHANHYTTDVVFANKNLLSNYFILKVWNAIYLIVQMNAMVQHLRGHWLTGSSLYLSTIHLHSMLPLYQDLVICQIKVRHLII